MSYPIAEKDVQENININVDWSDWLNSDTIVSSDWVVTSGLDIVSSQHSQTETLVWLEGGQLREHYYVQNNIETAAGRTSRRTFVVRVVSK